MISIVIPSYKHLSECLRPCLESIKKHTKLDDIEIIVVLNGCGDDGSKEFVESLGEPFRYVWLDEPSGYTHSTNVGIREAKGEYIVLLNNDTVILGEQWLSLLLKPFQEDERVGISGPLMLHCPDADEDFLVFFCAMISRECLDSIGGQLDASYQPGYGEDCDAAIQARRKGWKVVQVPPSQPQLVDKGCEDLPQWKRDKMWHNPFPIYHDGNKTFGDDHEAFDVILNRNKKILRERYRKVTCPCDAPTENQKCDHGLYLWRAGLVDGWFGLDEGHQLAHWVSELPKGAKVLEIGAWHGRSSRFIADNLPENGQVWCCDTWNGSSGEPEMHGSARQREGDHAHQWWWCNLQEHIATGRVVPVRMHSANAAHTIGHLIEKGQMEKFDLIFIDGDHSAEGIKTDVESWLPLLKEGGLICGHDYYKEGEGLSWVFVRQYVESKFPNVEKAATSLWYIRPTEQPAPRIIDAFIFNDELDILEIRLSTLYDHIDRFVLVEGALTHSGKPKALHFDENKERYAKYLDKITHVIVDDYPKFPEPTDLQSRADQAWARERHQRDGILHGLQGCKDDDIILIGDADEIANPEAIKNYKPEQGLCRLKQRLFYYYLNCENKDGWDWHKIAPYKIVKELTPCGVRYPPAGDTPLIESSGWHFSFLGGAEAAMKKVADYAHVEFATDEILNKDRIEKLINEGRDIFGRDLKYEFVEIDENYPQHVRDNQKEMVQKGLWRVRSPQTSSRLYHCTHCNERQDGPVAMCEKCLRKVLNRKAIPEYSSLTVTAEISTKDRYHLLPLTISAILNQTRKPERLVIYDDGEQKDLRELEPFSGLFKLAGDLGVKWEIFATPRKGQVTNHQHCLDTCKTDLVWRIDDDEIAEPDCLENLLKEMKDGVGAVAGLVHHPSQVAPLPPNVNGSLGDFANGGFNLQWCDWNGGPREVQHLYSTFLYRADAAKQAGGYPRNLSPVCHREETIFTHGMYRAGFKLIVTPFAKTHHLRGNTGGIRAYNRSELWQHDEEIFQEYLRLWNVVLPDTKFALLDCGRGDHLLFRGLLIDEFHRKHPKKKWVLATCFPEIFNDLDYVTQISIAEAKLLVGDRWENEHLYAHCWKENKKQSIVDSMREFWGE